MSQLTIDNSYDAAIKNGKWENPGAKFYDQIVCYDNLSSYRDLLEEAYLIAPTSKIKNNPHGRTMYSNSGCKYPHHSIKNGKLVVNISGLKAAYSRAKANGDFKGALKSHLLEHYEEMGIYEGSTMESDNIIQENFVDIIDYICESVDEDDEEIKAIKKAAKKDVRAEKAYTRQKDDYDDEFVPVYGLVKSYNPSKVLNDGVTPKNSEAKMNLFTAKIVNTLTFGDNYSHAVLSFDDSFENMYSFVSNGMVRDTIMEDQIWYSTKSIYICVMFIPKRDCKRMKDFVKRLLDTKTYYPYFNLITAFVGNPDKRDNRFLCSGFVSYIMQCSNSKNLHRDYSRIRPEDFTIMPRAFYVMNVKDKKDFIEKRSSIRQKTDAIWDEYHEEIEEYNNQLPKLMLVNAAKEHKTGEKLLKWILTFKGSAGGKK